MTETALIIVSLLLMVIALLVSLIPYVPGPALLWAIGFGFAILNGFERVTILTVIIMTVLMIIGSTNEIWLRYFGMKRRGGSCWGALGSVIGGIIGTGVIPVPIVGTLVGAILGALLVEFMRLGQVHEAMQAGRTVLEMYLVGIVVELMVSLSILSVFAASLWLTA